MLRHIQLPPDVANWLASGIVERQATLEATSVLSAKIVK
jgi:hypothetical protein